MKQFSITLFLCAAIANGLAQEGLKPLHANLSFVYPELRQQAQAPTGPKTAPAKKILSVTTLYLPFIEDFYYAQSRPYPIHTKWMDSGTYVNQGYPMHPPSIGVATFDGLNKYGYPYEPALLNNTLSHPADTLTSRPINLMVTASSQTLQPSDSVGLSFYYESTGYGDSPEVSDSLILDFYCPLSRQWVNAIWVATRPLGSNAIKGDTTFQRAFVMIDSAVFLLDSFQFRFRNKATTTGNFDHWHVDYIHLDKNRSLIPSPYDDLTFLYVPTPFLRDYSSMPWEQYNTSEMAQHNLVKIANNGPTQINMSYTYLVDSLNKQLCQYSGNSNVMSPGTTTYLPHAQPTISCVFQPMTDSLDYTIVHTVQRTSNTSDFIANNDTVIQHQRFRNYYSLDDGSAEAGYYLNVAGGKMAIKINVNNPDSFLGARIYFDPVGGVSNAKNALGFHLCVWAIGTNGPGALLYRDTVFKPTYYDTTPGYSQAEFKLFRPKLLQPGTYYIGIQQLADPNPVTIGFDCNVDHRTSLYYDSGGGWIQSGIGGSLMIHPIFGRTLPHPVGIREIPYGNSNIAVYPNPASNQFVIRSSLQEQLFYTLCNAMGQSLRTGSLTGSEELLDASTLPAGIYFISFRTGMAPIQQQKLIIQR